jgi:hypothetical protein
VLVNEPRMLRIELPPGFHLLNANGRYGTYVNKATGARVPRSAARARAIKEEVVRQVQDEPPFTGKVRIRAIYFPNSKRPHDPGNLFPSVKAAVDALHPPQRNKKPQPFVHILDDDSSRYVTELSMIVAERVVRGGQLVIQVIEERDDG